MESAKNVLIVGSFAPSLVHFRGPLIAAMIERGHKVVAAAPRIDHSISAELRRLGAEPREIDLSNASLNPLALLRSLRSQRSLVRDTRPDVLIAYTVKPVVISALVGRSEGVARIVSLITGAGYAFTGGREAKRLVSRLAASLLYRAALKRSDVVIFQNPDDQRLFRTLRLVSAEQETHIVNGSGVDVAKFSPTPLPDKPSFLMIARLLRDKGIREFANAAKRLNASHPDVPLALVGGVDPSPDSITPTELDELRASGVDYKGHLADVRPAISDCSVYVLPSYREGTPRSVLEAMAMGRAIITTDAPGCRETVRNGENGILIPPRDSDALYGAMLRFVEDPKLAATMGPVSRSIAESKYDVDQVNRDILTYAGL